MCDFNNPQLTCPHCGFIAEALTWMKPCDKRPLEPGSQLRQIFRLLNVKEKEGCHCSEKYIQMDQWGVDGCKEHFDEIVAWLKEGIKEYDWGDVVAASLLFLPRGIKVNPFDPFTSLVRLAITRTEGIKKCYVPLG